MNQNHVKSKALANGNGTVNATEQHCAYCFDVLCTVLHHYKKRIQSLCRIKLPKFKWFELTLTRALCVFGVCAVVEPKVPFS